MSKVEQEIFKSIQTIAKRIVDRAGYDRTIKGIVVSIPQKDEEPKELFEDMYDDEELLETEEGDEPEEDGEPIEDEYTNTFSNEYNNGFYIVRNGEARYQAKYNGNQKIKVGDSVFVLIPQGNPANTKYILGLV